jgi:hypothetical protein
MKKAEISTTFTFLTASIVLGVILIFGSFAVLKIINNVSDLEESAFINQFNREISRMSAQFGSIRYLELPRVQGYKEICVVSEQHMAFMNISQNFYNSSSKISRYPLIRGHLEDRTANVFLIRDNVEQTFFNDQLRLSDGKTHDCFLIPASGLVEVQLEGFGRYTELTFIRPD